MGLSPLKLMVVISHEAEYIRSMGTFVGVLYDSQGKSKIWTKSSTILLTRLPTLFNWLNASRTILEAGDFWLLLLGGVLVLVFKAAAPLMMAVAIDQKLAHKVTYPFVWGAAVLTLLWPAVSYFIRALALSVWQRCDGA